MGRCYHRPFFYLCIYTIALLKLNHRVNAGFVFFVLMLIRGSIYK